MIDDSTLYCTFRMAGRLFGVPVLDVKEVTAQTSYTRVPHAPEEVLGLVNIRGHIFLALNLAHLLAIPGHKYSSEMQMVIFKSSTGPAFGIFVDQVGEMMAIPESQREPFSNQERFQLDSNDRAALVSHVCKLDQELLVVLDARKFLPCVERTIQALLQE